MGEAQGQAWDLEERLLDKAFATWRREHVREKTDGVPEVKEEPRGPKVQAKKDVADKRRSG